MPTGRAIMADSTRPIASARRNYIPVSFRARGRIRFTARCPTTTSRTGNSNRKRRSLFRGSSRPIPSRAIRSASIAGSPFAKAIAPAYAQWEDCGPFRTDHFQYVFQNERPKPNLNRGAGLDVSPAVRDYLGLAADRCDRLAICGSSRCSAGSMADLRRQQSFRHCAPADGSAFG